jgi:hypothetical protein
VLNQEEEEVEVEEVECEEDPPDVDPVDEPVGGGGGEVCALDAPVKGFGPPSTCTLREVTSTTLEKGGGEARWDCLAAASRTNFVTVPTRRRLNTLVSWRMIGLDILVFCVKSRFFGRQLRGAFVEASISSTPPWGE